VLDSPFLTNFKRKTEAKWLTKSIDPMISGFQFQRGTQWLPGLSDEQIAAYEAAVGAHSRTIGKRFYGK